MANTKKRSRPQYSGAEIITMLLYLCSMSSALMYVLCREAVVPCAIIMTLVSFGIYMLFYVLRNRKPFAVLAFMALALLSFLVMGSVFSSHTAIYFVDFIFKASETYNVFFAAAAIFLFSNVIGFTSCYFSAYLPRPAFLLLPALIPLILSARTAGGLPAGLTVFMAVGYAAALMGIARPEFPKETIYINEKKSRLERLACFGIFLIITTLVIAVVPRDQNTPLGDKLDTVFNKQRGFYGTRNLSNFTDTSGINHGGNTLSDDVLFYVTTENSPTYVGRWAFDNYKGEEGWKTSSEYTTGYAGWENSQSRLNYGALSGTLKRAAASGKLERYADDLLALESVPRSEFYKTSRMTIKIADGSNTRVVIHPNAATRVSITGYDEKIFRTAKDELFTDRNYGQNASYVVEYYLEKPSESFMELFTRVDMEELLNAAVAEEVIDEATRDSFLSEKREAQKYYSVTDRASTDPRISALAKEITAGLKTNYEKAAAIEKWFGDEGFVYDLDFIPAKTTAEYFLFESKRGICSDFASASALLMREAGIPTRYCEGFLLDENSKDEFGRYVVKSAHAHAYAMGYTEGGGWTVVDGTRFAAIAGEDKSFETAALVLLIVLAVTAIAAIVFRKQVSELFFRLTLTFRSAEGKVRALYLRTRKLACAINGKDPKTSASGEVQKTISLSLNLPVQAAEITQSADLLFYGKTLPEISPKKLYSDYKDIYKMKRRMRK